MSKTDVEKLVEAMASNEAFQGAVYGVPGFHTIEDCARAALAAAREAGWTITPPERTMADIERGLAELKFL